MTGQDIVCFARDWDDHPTSNNHVMRRLARDNRVLWISSIGMRAPRAGTRDGARIVRKIRAFLDGPREAAPNLWVLSPLVVPLPHAPWATSLNRSLLRTAIRRAALRLGMRRFQVWSFLPNTVDYAADLDPTILVYYCVDDWAHAGAYDGARLAAAEARLCGRADIVFATSQPLAEAKRALNPATYLAPHGVDHAHFARALDPRVAVAPELRSLRQPVIGYVGLIDERVDQALLAHVAARHPEWTVALAGRSVVDTSALAAHPNVRFLGHVPYERLPELLKGFAAALVPFAVNEYTRHVNPLKLREYLSAGVGVVSSDLPEVAAYGRWCTIARDAAHAVRALETLLATDTATLRARRSAAMRAEGWDARVMELARVVDRIRQRRAA